MTQTAKSTVLVTLEIECSGAWSDTTTMKQIVQQTREEAQGRIRRLFEEASKDQKDLSCNRAGAIGIHLKSIDKVTTRIETT